MEKLPIWATVKESFGFCFGNMGKLMGLALIPMALYAAMVLVQFNIYDTVMIDAAMDGLDEESLGNAQYWPALFNVISMLLIIPVITAWHRNYLISLQGGELAKLQVSGNELRYLGYLIAVTLIAMLAAFIPIFGGVWMIASETALPVGVLLVIFGAALAFYVSARLTMVFPAAAIGAPAGLKDSWRATKGYAMRIIAVQLLLALLLGLVFAVVAGVVGAGITPMLMAGNVEAETLKSVSLVSGIVYIPVEVVITAVGVSCLSIIYKFLSERDDRVEAEYPAEMSKY